MNITDKVVDKIKEALLLEEDNKVSFILSMEKPPDIKVYCCDCRFRHYGDSVNECGWPDRAKSTVESRRSCGYYNKDGNCKEYMVSKWGELNILAIGALNHE